MRTYIREQRTLCGPRYMEVDLFRVGEQEHRANTRRKRELASSLAQQAKNEKYSKRRFVQIVNTNFSPAALVLHLTYDDGSRPAPGDKESCDRDFTNFIRRMRRYMKKNGRGEAKWVSVGEYDRVDEDGTVHGRPHFHMIVEGDISRDELEALWCRRNGEKLGLTRCERLDFDHGSVEGLVRYMLKRNKFERRWRMSRNLKMPEHPRPNDTKWSRKRLHEAATLYVDDRNFWERQYPGYRLNGVEPELNGNGDWHLVVKLRRDPEPERRKPHKKTRKRGGLPEFGAENGTG